jgi:hypothetical protein
MKIILRIAVVACLLIPLAAQSANIQISSLPFAITAPGTYVVTGDLTFSSPPQPNGTSVAAITISTALSGPVVVDLKGFTITGSGGETVGFGIGGGDGFFAGTNVPNTYPITIRNGILRNFPFGVWGEITNGGFLSNIVVNNLAIYLVDDPNGNGKAILFDKVNSSSVNNCSIHGGTLGIQDFGIEGGNSYNNDVFVGVNPIFIGAGGVSPAFTLTTSHCQFDAP